MTTRVATTRSMDDDASTARSLAAGDLVWQRWHGVWYMARVVAVADGSVGDTDPSQPTRVQIRAHGERDTADKWFDADSDNIRALHVLDTPDTRVGSFPARGDFVRLLVIDREALCRSTSTEAGRASSDIGIVGVVHDVVVSRDASIVDIDAFGGRDKRRVHIGNGYVRSALRSGGIR